MTVAQRTQLANLKLQLRYSIGKSRTKHGAWAQAHKTNNWPLRKKNYAAWKAQVAHSTELSRRIAALEAAIKNVAATTASLDLAKAVAVWEGGRSADGLFHRYQDVVGVWTIGYGHTAADGSPNPNFPCEPLTNGEATTLLLHDLQHFYAPAVNNAMRGYSMKPTQKQFDALTDFAYNLGPGYFSPAHDLGQAIKSHSSSAVVNAMEEYDRAGGAVLADLWRRRHWEGQLFLGGTYGGAG
jgi:lysozyme